MSKLLHGSFQRHIQVSSDAYQKYMKSGNASAVATMPLLTVDASGSDYRYFQNPEKVNVNVPMDVFLFCGGDGFQNYYYIQTNISKLPKHMH